MVSSNRPRTPSSGVHSNKLVRPVPDANGKINPEQKERRSSFGMLLRRSKSGDLGKNSKKAREQELLRQQQAAIPQSPPRLPDLYNGATPPKLQTFGGDDRPDSLAIMSGQYVGRSSMDPGRAPAPKAVPVPPIPNMNGGRQSDWVDPYARTESMTHRGRYSYASSAVSSINSPRRVRRRKDPTPFNILIIGAKSAGKTSFLNFLKTALALPPKKRPITRATDHPEDIFGPNATKYNSFKPHYLESEIDGERVGLTLWDSEGLDKGIVDLQLREMSFFLESKFEETFNEEMKVIRAPGVQDTHIHCAFLILDPARLDRNLASSNRGHLNGNGKSAEFLGPLDASLDVQVLRTLEGKTTVIPVISKADTITTAHMAHLKRSVWATLKNANLDPLESLSLDDIDDDKIDEDDESEDSEVPSKPATPQSEEKIASPGTPTKDVSSNPTSPTSASSKRLSSAGSLRQHRRNQSLEPAEQEQPYLPLSIISPDIYEPEVIGRKFPWGFADPYNPEHCDFVRLKDSVFSEWRGELREASRELWYERWRTSRLKLRDVSAPARR